MSDKLSVKVCSEQVGRKTSFNSALDFDLTAPSRGMSPGANTHAMEANPLWYPRFIYAFYYTVGQMYSLCETLAENFVVNSINLTECYAQTTEHINEKTKTILPWA